MRRVVVLAILLSVVGPLALVSDAAVAVAQGAGAGWPDLMTPPARQGGGEKDAAVVVGVSDYAEVPDVPGASENAAAWVAWLVRARGVPFGRVKFLRDREATDLGLREAAKKAAGLVKPGGTLWFVDDPFFVHEQIPTWALLDVTRVGRVAHGRPPCAPS